MGAVFRVLEIREGIGQGDPARGGITPFVPDRAVHRPGLEPPERPLVELRLVLARIEVAVGAEAGVRRMVVPAVELAQRFDRELGDLLGVAAAVVVVGRGGIQLGGQRVPEARAGRAERAPHLVVDHALVDQLALGVAGHRELQAMALLREVERTQMGEEHGVEIDLQQVVEVLVVLAREHIGGPVAAGEGVHEGIERTPGHEEKRVSHREALAAAEHGVLQDVRDAGRVLWDGPKRQQEGVVVVVGGQVQVPRPGSGMSVLLGLQVERRDAVAA